MGNDDKRSMVAVVKESTLLAYTVGAMSLVAGAVLLFWPDRTITVVARLTGVLLLIVGLGELWDTLRTHRSGTYWPLLAVRAVLNIGFGAALLFWPGVTVGVLVWIAGLDLVLTGILGLVVRGRMPSELRGPLLVRSLVTIGFGLVLMIWPDATVAAVAFLVGALLVLIGLVLIWSGRQISKADVVVV